MKTKSPVLPIIVLILVLLFGSRAVNAQAGTALAPNGGPAVWVDLPYQEVHTGWPIEVVTLSAIDFTPDTPLSISTSWRASSLLAQSELPYGTSLTAEPCTPSGDWSICTWTLKGRALYGEGIYTINATVSDGDGVIGAAEIKIVVFNEGPVADAGGSYTVPEGGEITLTGLGRDPERDPLTYAWDLDNDGHFEARGESVVFSAAGRDGPDTQEVVFRVCDLDAECFKARTTVDLVNAAPELTNGEPEQSVQYSDPLAPVTITASDVAADALTVATAWTRDGGAAQDGLPDGLALTATACTPDANNLTCAWTLSGEALGAPGNYQVTVSVDDEDGGVSSTALLYTVQAEDAKALYTGDTTVWTPTRESNGAKIRLAVAIQDVTAADPATDSHPGDIRYATVTFVNPDTGATLCAAPVLLSDEADPKTGAAACNWDVTLEGNKQAFTVRALVGGNYTGGWAKDVVVTVSRAPQVLYFAVLQQYMRCDIQTGGLGCVEEKMRK